MDLAIEQVREVIKALKYARSVQSVHLSGSSVKQIKLIAQEILGHLVFDRITMHRVPPQVENDWNEHLRLPNTSEDITPQVASFMSNQATKIDHIKKLQEETLRTEGEAAALKVKSYQDCRYVLSRYIGRQDLTNNLKRMRVDPVQRVEVDIAMSSDPLLSHEFERKARSLDEICWIESQECWCCERWAYLLPVITKSSILESFPY